MSLSCFTLTLLVSFMLWETAHTMGGCSQFPKSNIHVKETVLNEPTALGSYITFSDDPRLLLRCYRSRDSKGNEFPVAVVTNAEGDHVTTIKHFHCDDKESFNKKTYIGHTTINKDKNLIVGILPKTETSGVWCQYNVCYTCNSAIESMAIKQVKQIESNLDILRWSEKGIEIDPNADYDYEKERKIKKEFLSIGGEAFVLTCYEDGLINIRTLAGRVILSIPDLKCHPDEYIQTFYILNIKKVGNLRYKIERQFQLAQHWDMPFLHSPLKNTETMFYYFSTSENTQPEMKMCYWNPINLETPNTCPTIRGDHIEFDSKYYNELTSQFEYEIVAVYQKDSGLTLKVVEVLMKNGEDNYVKASLVVVTDKNEKHILTLKVRYFLTLELFSRNFFIHDFPSSFYLNVQTKERYVLFGSRLDEEDDWCTYIIYQGDKTNYKFLYYGYKTYSYMFEWELVGGTKKLLSSRYSIDDKDIRSKYPEPHKTFLSGKYLWIGKEKQPSLILHCYISSANQPKSNVIKKTNGDTIVAIVEIDCLKSSSTNVKLRVVKMDENNYLLVSKVERLYEYKICLDCEETTTVLKKTYKHFSNIATVEWTEAGIEWKSKPETSQRETIKTLLKQWNTSGKTKLAIGSEVLSSGETRHSLRAMSGAVIGTLPVYSDDVIPRISYYVYTRNYEKSKVYTNEDCQIECDIRPRNKEVWVFHKIQDTGNGDFQPTKQPSCTGFKDVEFLFQEVESLKDKTPEQSYWNGGKTKMTVTCYHEDALTYAVIKNIDKHILTLKGFACSGSEGDKQIYDEKMAKLYIDIDRDDTDRIVVGMIDQSSSCYYSFATDGKDDGKWFYADYEPNNSAAQWYKQGECPGIPKETILINQKNGGNTKDLGNPVKTYVSLTHGEYKTLYCYQQQDQGSSPSHTVVMKSLTGEHYLTVQGLDCSDINTFSLNYYKNQKITYLALWKAVNTDAGCRYDICMNCPDVEILFNINKARIDSGKLEWIIMPEEQPGDKEIVDSVTGIKISIAENKRVKKEDYKLVIKFVSEDEYKINLHCYKKIKSSPELPDYVSEFTDASGQYLFHLLNHDCKKDKDQHPVTVAYNKLVKDQVFFLSILEDMYGICQKCERPFQIKILNFNNEHDLVKLTWKKENLDGCLKISRGDISVEENKFQFDDSYQVTKHISDTKTNVGRYELVCHSKHDSEDKRIAVIRDMSNGEHLLSINKIDCSSYETMNKEVFISIKREEDKVLVYLGKRPEFEQSQCQFEVCTSSKACDPEIKINYDLIDSNNWLKWSRGGIVMDPNVCPSLETETPCVQAGTCDMLTEYVQKNFNKIYTLACFKSKTESTYYLTLRTTKGFHIQTVTESENCGSFTQIITQFYIVKRSNGKHTFYDMNEPNMEEMIESCWGKNDNNENAEMSLYYFVGDDSDQTTWMTSSSLTQECPGLPRNHLNPLSKEAQQSLDGELLGEYSNAGRITAKLSCYKSKTGDSYYAIITNTNDGRMVKITDVNCADQNKLDDLFVDTGVVTIVGSQAESTPGKPKEWCFYSLYTNGDKIQTRHLTSYIRKPAAGVWLKDNLESCPAIKSENVITDESVKSTLDKHVPVTFVLVTFSFNKVFNPIRKHNVMRYRCYTMKNQEGKEIFVLVVTDAEGKHMVTVKDFDCSLNPSSTLKNRFYAVSMIEPNQPPFLALGSRASETDDWCDYGVCLNCEPKQLRRSASKYIANGYEVLVWNEGKSDDCPAIKREKIYEQIDEAGLDHLLVDSINVISVFNYKHEIFYTFDIKETLIIYCYYKVDSHGNKKYTMVIRSAERRHLVTVNDFDCSSAKQDNLQENMYAYTHEENSERLLLLGTRSPGTEAWCQYQICLTCPRSRIRRHIHEANTDSSSSVSIIYKWMPIIQVKGSLTRKEESEDHVAADDGSKLIVKYENGGIAIECYLFSDQGNVKKITIFLNEHGKRVIKLFEPNCVEVEALKKNVRVFNSKPPEQDGGLLVGIISSEETLCCTYKRCVTCEKGEEILDVRTDTDVSMFNEKVKNYDAKVGFQNEWLKVYPAPCKEIPESNIIVFSTLKSNPDLTASYINENVVDEDTFLMFCYENGWIEGEKILTRLKSLGKKEKGFDIAIKNLDCKSLLSEVYMRIERGESGDRYLILGITSSIKTDDPVLDSHLPTRSWCRVDICIDCKERLIKVSDTFDPSKLTPVKWSEAGINVVSPARVLRDAGFSFIEDIPLTSKFVHFEHQDFNIECRETPPTGKGDGNSFSIIKYRSIPLVIIPGRGCLARGFEIKNFYIYSSDSDSRSLSSNPDKYYYVTRMGPSFDINDFQYLEKTLYRVLDHWFYYFSGAESTEKHDWIEVQTAWDLKQGSPDGSTKKFKLEEITRKNFDASEEAEKCLPKNKKLSEFEPHVILDRKETQNKPKGQKSSK